MSQKKIFVIMPFSSSFERGKEELTYFFEDVLKKHIENHQDLQEDYIVRRSDTSLLINDSIIEDLHDADIVIADLSGRHPNANVMYELGIRFAASNRPTLLIRQAHEDNAKVFDVAHLYAQPYDTQMYGPLQEHLVRELKSLESGTLRYKSPVFKALEKTTSITEEIVREQTLTVLATIDAVCEEQRGVLAAYLLEKLRKKGFEDAPGTTAADMVKFLLENSEKIEKVDWTDFCFTVQSNSAIEKYLENPFASELFPQSLARKINGLFAAYYVRHVSTNFTWSSFVLDRVVGFFIETSNIELVADRCTSYLKQTDKDEAVRLISELHEILGESKLI